MPLVGWRRDSRLAWQWPIRKHLEEIAPEIFFVYFRRLGSFFQVANQAWGADDRTQSRAVSHNDLVTFAFKNAIFLIGNRLLGIKRDVCFIFTVVPWGMGLVQNCRDRNYNQKLHRIKIQNFRNMLFLNKLLKIFGHFLLCSNRNLLSYFLWNSPNIFSSLD